MWSAKTSDNNMSLFQSLLAKAGTPTFYIITVFAKLDSLTGNDKDVYYKKNAGSWTFLTTVSSTGCADWADIGGLVNGDVVRIAVEDNVTGVEKLFWGNENSTCAASGTQYTENTAEACGVPMVINVGSANINIALWITGFEGCI
jgi:hypothetical protein